MPVVVIDTNVLYAADDSSDPSCQATCLGKIQDVQVCRLQIALDEYDYILNEYARNTKTLDNTSVRKQFVNWLRAHRHTKCLLVGPQSADDTGVNFALFPPALAQANFHLDDRKFVAVALAAQQQIGQPVPILNAIDSDWCHHHASLVQNGIVVEFLCPDRVSPGNCP